MESNFLNLNLKDISRGLLTAVIAAILTYFYTVTQSGDFTTIDIKMIGSVALTSGIAYLSKNLLTNSEGEVLKKEDPLAGK